MSSYDELRGTVSRLADAAIEWDMAENGWHKTDNGWSSDFTVTGSTVLDLDATGTYLTDRSTGETWKPGEGEYVGVDFREMWRGWYERANDAFEPWLGLPEPSDMDPLVQALSRAAATLEVNTTVKAEAGKDRSGPALKSGNGGLEKDLAAYTGEILAMDGLAMAALSADYTNRVPGIVRANLAATGLAGQCATGQQQLIESTRNTITKIADDATQVMKDQGGGDDLSGPLEIVGAVLAGASLFFTGGAAAAVIANGSAILGVLGPFVPEDKASPAEAAYGGSTPSEVFDKVEEALGDAGTAMREEEQVVEDSLTQALGEMTGNPGNFDLDSPAGILGADNDYIAKGSDGVLDVDPDTMAIIARVYSPGVVSELRAARSELGSKPDRGAWYRDGAVGLSPEAGYQAMVDLIDQVQVYLTSTGRVMDDIADKLEDVARDFVDVDESVREYNELLRDDVANAG